MEELFAVLLQFFFEVAFQIIASNLLDQVASSRRKLNLKQGCIILMLHAIFGGILGWISTLIVPQFFLPYEPLRIANLALAPFVAGGLSWWFATWLKSRGNDFHPPSQFWHGFCFALLFGLVRFAFIPR